MSNNHHSSLQSMDLVCQLAWRIYKYNGHGCRRHGCRGHCWKNISDKVNQVCIV